MDGWPTIGIIVGSLISVIMIQTKFQNGFIKSIFDKMFTKISEHEKRIVSLESIVIKNRKRRGGS